MDFWLQPYEQRLLAWSKLREELSIGQELSLTLEKVNSWWFTAPIYSRYLHPEDVENWPDPWQLLEDNCICEVARALGMMYTLLIVDPDIADRMEMLYTGNDFLVSIDNGKYILNWNANSIVNIETLDINVIRRVPSSAVTKHIK